MRHRLILATLCLSLASPAFGQDAQRPSAHTPGPRSITKTEARKILATIATVNADPDSETDCSHFVHDVYEQAGFPFEYITSNDLYIGSINFTRVHKPQAGDLVVWRGHVGIVLDPKEHSFFSSVRTGPDTQFYDSPYWHSRGIARFYRYVTERPLRSSPTLEAARHSDHETLPAASHSLENRPPSRVPKLSPASNSVPAADAATSGTLETPRPFVMQIVGKNPLPEEVAAAFLAMNQDSGKSLRTRSLNSFGRPVVIYRAIRISALEVKGKRGSALIAIESLGILSSAEAGPQPRWREETLEFEKKKTGWVMSPIEEVTYVSREVALQSLSNRLAELAKNINATPEQEHEQKQIIRFLNLLMPDDSNATSAQSN
ncbi:MAG TPA: NlpC/P60 family protein [Candidatus Acidoferrum sp.]|nr:NlpC/P60 family protein [Candidatus Acidoferrum sp.]